MADDKAASGSEPRPTLPPYQPMNPGFQAVLSKGDGRLYSVDRDIAHNFGGVMLKVCKQLMCRNWSALDRLLVKKRVTIEELEEAVKAIHRFCLAGRDTRCSLEEAYESSGLLSVNQRALVAVMANIGMVYTGMFFHGARDASVGGPSPFRTVAELVDAGVTISPLVTMPGWKRFLYRARLKLRNIWNELRK